MSDHESRSAVSATLDSANGMSSLHDRVRALRLGNRIDEGKASGGALSWLPWTLCVLMAIAWVFVGSKWYPGSQEPMSSEAGAPLPATSSAAGTEGGVESTPEVASSGSTVLTAKGYVIPAHQISISPIEVSGRIIKLNIEEGKIVQEGHLLAELDSTSYLADLREAQAQRNAAKARYEELKEGPRPEEVKQLEAELAEARAQTEQARLEYERSREITGGALAAREFEESLYTYRANQERVRRLEQTLKLLQPREERVEAAKAEYEAAEARVTKAQFRFDNCQIVAPISGTILTKKAEVGNLINPVVGGISTSLCDMADLSDLEVELDVQERDIAKVEVGQACEVKSDAYPKVKFEAYVDRVMPIANRAKGVLPIRVKIIVPPEKAGLLKPEMGVVVMFFDEKSQHKTDQ